MFNCKGDKRKKEEEEEKKRRDTMNTNTIHCVHIESLLLIRRDLSRLFSLVFMRRGKMKLNYLVLFLIGLIKYRNISTKIELKIIIVIVS